jgi:redox-sensitive bicupin YhaK (pirin superfamily)
MDWLDSKHSFSFGNYYDQKWMSFGPLRVINDDYIGGGGGFDPHPHQDMEIISYVTEGGLAHRDSMGHSSVVTAGRTQRMSAGRGVIHSEHNASKDAPVHLYQIWIQPDQRGIAPEYEELDVAAAPVLDGWRLIASPNAEEGAMTIHQDARFLIGVVAAGQALPLLVPEGKRAWVHVADGEVEIAGETLAEGDAAIIEEAGSYAFSTNVSAELLWFEV